MEEVESTIIPKLQADIKQTATKKKNPVLFSAKCSSVLGTGSFLHFPEVRTPWGPREPAAVRALRGSGSQETPPALMKGTVRRAVSLALCID